MMKDLKEIISEFMRKHPWISSFIILILSLLLVWQLWIASNKAELRRLEAEIKERGEPLTHDDLNKFYRAVPDAENAALLYQEAFGKYHEASNEEAKQLIIVGTAPDLIPGERISPEILAASKAYIEKNKEAIELLKKAAAMEKCRFPVNFNDVWGTYLPHLTSMRQGAQLLALEAILKAEDCDIDSALDSLSAIPKMSRHLHNEPIMISFLVGIACEAIMMNSLEHCINSAKFSEGQIEKTREILGALPDLKEPAKNALMAERSLVTGESDKKIYKMIYLPELDILNEWTGIGFRKPFSLFVVVSGLGYSNRIRFIEYMNEAIKLSQIDYDRKAYGDFEREFMIKTKKMGATNCLLMFFAPVATSLYSKGATQKTIKDLLFLALESKSFEYKHGRLPEKLEELVPEFIPEVPMDIFDKKKVKIFKGEIKLGEKKVQSGEGDAKEEETVEVKKTGIIIYSVGSNGVDNSGGAPDRRKGYGSNSDISIIVLPIVDKKEAKKN